MKTIHKHMFDGLKDGSFYIHKGAKILSAQMQGSTLCIWAAVDTDMFVCGTGQPLTEGEFVGTVQMGPYVWHIFDGGEEP